MTYGGVEDSRQAVSESAYLRYTLPANISVVEPAYIVAQALAEYVKQIPDPLTPPNARGETISEHFCVVFCPYPASRAFHNVILTLKALSEKAIADAGCRTRMRY
jgi:hypothetical protein